MKLEQLITTLEKLEVEATPEMQIAQMTTYLDKLLVQFSDDVPTNEVLGFLTDRNLKAVDEMRSTINTVINTLYINQRLIEAVCEWKENRGTDTKLLLAYAAYRDAVGD